MELRGVGDRWLAGESVPGVDFAMFDAVSITGGPHAGEGGSIKLLVAVRPEPSYLVELGSGGGDVRVRQSELRAPA